MNNSMDSSAEERFNTDRLLIESKAEAILTRVRDQGAEADLIIDQVRALSLKANGGKLDEHKSRSTKIYGLRVIKDNKVGMAYSEADDEKSLHVLTQQALLNARFSSESPNERILNQASTLSTDNKSLAPSDSTSTEQKIELVLWLEQELLNKKGITRVPYNGLSEALVQRQILSTSGLNAYSKKRNINIHAYALAETKHQKTMQGTGQSGRLINTLNPEQLVEQVNDSCQSMLSSITIPSQKVDVIFNPEMQASLFAAFSSVFSAKAAMDGINPWQEKIGKPIADSSLNLSDTPLNTEGLSCTLFDAEGSICNNTPIIQQGQLTSFLHNSVTASYFGVSNNAHARRSAKMALGVSRHQLCLEPGSYDENDLRSGSYLEITDLAGLRSGGHPVSGNFSYGAAGFLCKDGKRIQSVKGITVAGNFYQILNSIKGIGKQQHWNWKKDSLMPSIRFSELSISG